jgi:cytochrome b561
VETYTRPARLFHWLTAGLLLASFSLGLSMTRVIEGDMKLRVYSWHEWVGVTIFAVTMARLLWRIRHRPPPLDLSWIERVGAGVVYVAMYMVLLVQPIVGWMMSSAFGFPVVYLGLLPLPLIVAEDRELAARLQQLHFNLAMVLVALFLAHLGGVLYHHLILQDSVLRRMLPGPGPARTGSAPNAFTTEDTKDTKRLVKGHVRPAKD